MQNTTNRDSKLLAVRYDMGCDVGTIFAADSVEGVVGRPEFYI